eukprot:3664388-Alexandrium_andersonii.AAC.1
MTLRAVVLTPDVSHRLGCGPLPTTRILSHVRALCRWRLGSPLWLARRRPACPSSPGRFVLAVAAMDALAPDAIQAGAQAGGASSEALRGPASLPAQVAGGGDATF